MRASDSTQAATSMASSKDFEKFMANCGLRAGYFCMSKPCYCRKEFKDKLTKEKP